LLDGCAPQGSYAEVTFVLRISEPSGDYIGEQDREWLADAVSVEGDRVPQK